MKKKKKKAGLIAADLYSISPLVFTTASTASPYKYTAKCTITFVDTTFDAAPGATGDPAYDCKITVGGVDQNASIDPPTYVSTLKKYQVAGVIRLERTTPIPSAAVIEVTITVTKKNKIIASVGPQI